VAVFITDAPVKRASTICPLSKSDKPPIFRFYHTDCQRDKHKQILLLNFLVFQLFWLSLVCVHVCTHVRVCICVFMCTYVGLTYAQTHDRRYIQFMDSMYVPLFSRTYCTT
jgi:hypothetical protein